jgi:hypothetical protein
MQLYQVILVERDKCILYTYGLSTIKIPFILSCVCFPRAYAFSRSSILSYDYSFGRSFRSSYADGAGYPGLQRIYLHTTEIFLAQDHRHFFAYQTLALRPYCPAGVEA